MTFGKIFGIVVKVILAIILLKILFWLGLATLFVAVSA